MVDREGKNQKGPSSPGQGDHNLLPYYDELMDQKKSLKAKTYNPGPGQYEIPVGFDMIKKTMGQVKHLQNQGLENFGIQVIKNSCNFQSKKNRFDNRELRDKALMPGPGAYNADRPNSMMKQAFSLSRKDQPSS